MNMVQQGGCNFFYSGLIKKAIIDRRRQEKIKPRIKNKDRNK